MDDVRPVWVRLLSLLLSNCARARSARGSRGQDRCQAKDAQGDLLVKAACRDILWKKEGPSALKASC